MMISLQFGEAYLSAFYLRCQSFELLVHFSTEIGSKLYEKRGVCRRESTRFS